MSLHFSLPLLVSTHPSLFSADTDAVQCLYEGWSGFPATVPNIIILVNNEHEGYEMLNTYRAAKSH